MYQLPIFQKRPKMITPQAIKDRQPDRDMIEQATQAYLKNGNSINVIDHKTAGIKEGNSSSNYGRSYKI